MSVFQGPARAFLYEKEFSGLALLFSSLCITTFCDWSSIASQIVKSYICNQMHLPLKHSGTAAADNALVLSKHQLFHLHGKSPATSFSPKRVASHRDSIGKNFMVHHCSTIPGNLGSFHHFHNNSTNSAVSAFAMFPILFPAIQFIKKYINLTNL